MKKIVLSIVFVSFLLYGQLPEEEGPYYVGCRVDTLSRISSVDSSLRVMLVYTWYPATPGTGFYLDVVRAYWRATPLGGDTLRPLVIFSHGGCGTPLASVYFTSHLAGWGFIVIATSHPGSMWGDEDCLDSAALHYTWLNRPDDVQYTVDSMVALSSAHPELFGRIDTSRMAMSGHSFGARTTYAVCNRQNWAKCAVALSGDYDDIFGAPINCMDDIRGVDVPIMLMCGSLDIGLEPEHMAQIYDTLKVPKVSVEIFGATHFSFSDTCTPELDPFCGEDFVLNYDTAHAIINRYATAFLMKYLLSDDRFSDYIFAPYDSLAWVWFDTGSAMIQASEPPAKIRISAVPDPFNSACRISVEGIECSGEMSVKIYDLFGRCVFESRSESGEIVWFPRNISGGIYFVRVINGGTFLNKRVFYIK
ncbi:hypothetical protein J7K99_01365 [bacterium]|nr:hypothetical protein [bacterium]